MSRPAPLRTKLSAAVLGVAALPVLAVGVVVGGASVQGLEQSAFTALGRHAGEVAYRLDTGLHERWNDVISMAAVVSAGIPAPGSASRDTDHLGSPATTRGLLEQLRAAAPAYAWIGLAAADGKVIASTGGQLEQADVSQRPWFRGGLQAPFAGDVHEAVLLAKLLGPTRDGAPPRFVDVAAPVRRPDGVPVAVVGAHLSWSWAEEVEEKVLEGIDNEGVEAFIVARDGSILLGPGDTEGGKVELRSLATARQGVAGVTVERWPDGLDYVTAVAPTGGKEGPKGLGWTVLLRQKAEVALAPAHALRQRILMIALLAAGGASFAGLWLARRVAAPLSDIAAAADRLARGATADVPYTRAFAEAASLSTALTELEARLGESPAQAAQAR
ncbi:cache domain-containing protein [Arenibaculum pallidiluteum]|uniref:cache domain-containing protein n=1 Tax=Arenibaculum pallidiluteum TaxID=2812559 RepID=UPI001A965FA2|nr:cache domain-containing protein [Arenibaculum pallidiluteum]